MKNCTRREMLRISGAAVAATAMSGSARAAKAPVAPVAVAQCRTYGKEMYASLNRLFDQLGGLAPLVRGKTVAIKVNLTGGVQPVLGGRSAGRTYHVHPDVVLATCQALGHAGARRVRLLEGWNSKITAEAFLGECGWDLNAFRSSAPVVEFENTNNRGSSKQYSVLKPAHGGYVFPSFHLNHSYEDTDVFISLAKMKNHYTSGVTLALKNCFGVAPSSFYGDDAGSELAGRSRGQRFHFGKLAPPAPAAAEKDQTTPREPGYRVPRITVDLVAAIHPINLSIIDGIETVQGGEGPWIKPLRILDPGLLVAGLNPVCTDAVCTGLMGYDPQGEWTSPPFYRGDNTMKLAEAAGIGSADLKNIEVRGISIEKGQHKFEPNS